MSLFNSFDRTRHLNELAEPLDTQAGVLSPATRRAQTVANLFGDTAVSDGLIFGIGTASNKYALGSTAGNGINLRFNATHTTGDMRGVYLRLDFSGAGGSGEALRVYSNINNVSVATGGTVNGAHISTYLNGATANVSGAANALRVTFGSDALNTTPGGTLAALQVDTDLMTGVTVPASHAFIRFTNSGAVSFTRLMEVPNVASGAVLAVHALTDSTHSLRIRSADGTLYYIMVSSSAAGRTGGA